MTVNLSDVSFSRASGATRVNAAGLIVGVDFSSTSNTITTGSKTFTLAADANVNRDWPVGSAVRAVDQVGGGVMIGTVSSYTASTQVLVINVTSITGSGTSTNWRIGSLEIRRDYDPVTLAPKGFLVEGQATNLLNNSANLTAANWVSAGATASRSFGGLGGYAFKLNGGTPSGDTYPQIYNNGIDLARYGQSVGQLTVLAKAQELGFMVLSIFRPGDNNNAGVVVDLNSLETRFFRQRDAFGESQFSAVSLGGGWVKVSLTRTTTNNPGYHYSLGVTNTLGSGTATPVYTGNGLDGILVEIPELYDNPGFSIVQRSFIPTTTVAVTRAADLASVTGTNFTNAFDSTKGALVFEFTPSVSTLDAVVASLNDGTLNNAIRLTKMPNNDLTVVVISGGVTSASVIAGKVIANVRNRAAITYHSTGVSISVNGAVAVSDPSITLPIINQYTIGMAGNQTLFFNGPIKTQKAYRAKVSNSELQALSRV